MIFLSLRSLLRRNHRRNALTVIAVAAATVVVCIVAVVAYAVRLVVNQAEGSPRLIVMNRAGVFFGLPESYAGRIASLPSVVAVTRVIWYAGVYQDPREQFATYAVDANPDRIWPEWGFQGPAVEQFKKQKDAALVGFATMQRLGWHLGQTIQLRSQTYPATMTFEIVGTFNRGPDPTAFISRLDYFEDILRQPVNVHLIWVRCTTLNAADSVKGAIDETFHNADSETETFNEKKHLANYVAPFKPVVAIIEALGLYAIFGIGLAVLNASAMSVRERAKEIATLRALGFAGSSILAGLLLESAVLAIAGGVLGIGLSWLLMARVGGAVPALGPLLGFGLPFPVMSAGLGIAAAIGVASALIPARSAVRASVASMLRKVV